MPDAVFSGTPSSPTKGFLFALCAVILWSGNFIVARALNQTISPIALAFFRWLLGTLFLLPFVATILQQQWKACLPHWKYLSITAITGVTVFNTLVYVAGHYTTAINMALIGTTASPVFVFLIAATILRQKFSPYQYAGIVICLAGILYLLSGGRFDQLSQFRFSTGDLWILAAALSFAIYTLLVRKKPTELAPTVFLFAVFFLGTLFLLPAFIIDRIYSAPIQWNGTIIGSLLYLGLGTSVLAFLAWNSAIRLLGPAKTSLFGNLIPVFSSLEAAWILGEKLGPATLYSFMIILIGIVIANFTMFRKQTIKT